MRVLVAEDDREMNAVLVEALSADGHDVVSVDSGTDALAVLFDKARDRTPEVAVMDVRMPGLSGLQVLTAVRRGGMRVRVIIITAFGDEAVHQEAMALGAAGVLDKPFDVDDLRSVVMRLRHAS